MSVKYEDPDTLRSPPNTATPGRLEAMAPCTPLTKNLTSEGSVGNPSKGESATTNVPDIAVVETRDPPLTLPDTVPTSAIDSLSSCTKY
jgi:hypothetical protein